MLSQIMNKNVNIDSAIAESMKGSKFVCYIQMNFVRKLKYVYTLPQQSVRP